MTLFIKKLIDHRITQSDNNKLMSSNLKQQVDTVLNSLSQPFKCNEWCDSNYYRILKKKNEVEYTLKSHVCSYSSTLYVFLRHLFEGKTNYSQIDDSIVTTHDFLSTPHLLIFLKDGSFCIHGQHLKGFISSTQNPFFSGLLLALLERLSENEKYPNAINLWKLLINSKTSFIDIVKNSLSEKHLIENNDLKTLKLIDNKTNEDKLLVIFYSVLNNTYKTRNGKYVSYIDGDKIFFQSGNDLSFRDSSYVYFIRSVFLSLLEAIGSIEQAGEEDSDFDDDEEDDQ